MTDARVEVVARVLCGWFHVTPAAEDRFWQQYEWQALSVLAALDAHDREAAGAMRDQVDGLKVRDSGLKG